MLPRSGSLFLSVFLLVWAAVPSIALLGDDHEIGEIDNDHYVQELAVKAVGKLNAHSNDIHHWKLDRLVSAQRQVVSGLKYTLKLVITRSECTKDADDAKIHMNLCSVRDDAPKQICHYEVLVREWEGSEEFTSKGCLRHTDEVVDPPRPAHHLRNNQEAAVTKTKDNVFKIGKHIKPKDFAAWNLFNGYIDRHSKNYKDKKEILKRFRIYKRNLRAAKMWQENEQGTAVYGETPYMDLTSTEFRSTYLPYRWQQPKHPIRKLKYEEVESVNLPDSFDWRTKGAVTAVKNQEACGSCWAFSVTGNVEGQWFRKSGSLVSLSEQELVDCDVVDQGCNGGLPANAYKEIIRMGGLEPEKDYPYDGHRETCHLDKRDLAVYINDSLQLPADEVKMAEWLVKNGPISIGVNANPLQFYRHGISHPWKIFCSPLFLNHGVLIVGFGQEGNKPFWIIKNSWGESWGESGYYRLYRGKNVCGVNSMATSAIVH